MIRFTLLAAAASPSPSSTPIAIDPNRVTPGVLGFLAIVFMALAVFGLWKSMSKQLKRVDFDEAATDRKKPQRATSGAAQAEASDVEPSVVADPPEHPASDARG